MATNPNNSVGTNAAYSGRTSVNAFNDDLSLVSRGVISGWGCSPSSGLTVVLGGSGSVRDVAVAEDNAGNRTTINNISGSPIPVTLAAAPGSNSRIDAIVAYVDNPPQGTESIADNYEACGLISVAGTVASSPSAPTENAIRSAITADGASGTTAYYVVLAYVTLSSGVTDITADRISAGESAGVSADNIDFTTFTDSGVIRMGTKKIMWGTGQVNSVPTSTDRTVQITFPEAFNTTPIVSATCSGWLAIRGIFIAERSTTNATVGVYHQQGSTINVPFNWIAIG